MILFVDTGNKQIKTEHAVLNANIKEIVENNATNYEEDASLEYKEKFYTPSNKRMRYLHEKLPDKAEAIPAQTYPLPKKD